MLDALLVALGGLGGVLGREVLGRSSQARLEPVDERLVARPVQAGAFDLVEPGLVRGGPRDRRLVALEFDAVPAAQRSTAGRVSPWPTSVTRITAKVTSRIRFRSGKSAGSARAAASETAPRRPGPADDEGEPACEPRVRRAITRRGDPGRRLDRRPRRAGDDDDHGDERREADVCTGGRPRSPSRIAGNSSPIRTKTKPLRTNPIIFQVVCHRTRLFGRQDRAHPAADNEPRRDGGEHPGQAELIGRQVGRERDHHRDHDLDRRVVESAQDLAGAPADDEPRSRSRRERRPRNPRPPRSGRMSRVTAASTAAR